MIPVKANMAIKKMVRCFKIKVAILSHIMRAKVLIKK
jgi:hypothetical protein